jgi:hypothetical protein
MDRRAAAARRGSRKLRNWVWTQVWARVGYQLGHQVDNRVYSRASSEVINRVDGQVWPPRMGLVKHSIWSQAAEDSDEAKRSG